MLLRNQEAHGLCNARPIRFIVKQTLMVPTVFKQTRSPLSKVLHQPSIQFSLIEFRSSPLNEHLPSNAIIVYLEQLFFMIVKEAQDQILQTIGLFFENECFQGRFLHGIFQGYMASKRCTYSEKDFRQQNCKNISKDGVVNNFRV